ncbi:MAG TPA: ABC transporter ATP-binding protein [Allosphingosinicella sp.]|nr:ABC transporter ATP-binding protein [Allosphingosinicella sp.]
MANLSRLLRHVGADGRRHLTIALGLTALATVTDIVSLALLQRGMTAIRDNDAATSSGGFGTITWFLIAAGAASMLRLFAVRHTVTAQFAINRSLAASAFAALQYESYADYVRRGASAGIAAFDQLQLVIYNALAPMIMLTTTALGAVSLCLAMAVLHPLAGAVLLAGLALVAVEGAWRGARAADAGITATTQSRARLLFEARNSFRDIYMANGQARVCEDFAALDGALRERQAESARAAQSSRHGIEVAAFGAAAVLSAVIASGPRGWSDALPALGTLALASFRLLPQVGVIRASLRTIGAHGPVTADMIALLDGPRAPPMQPGALVTFRDRIELRGVTVRRDDRPVTLDGLDFVIPRGARIGISGASGAGKSTLLDVICGAVGIDRGALLLDGEPMDPSSGMAWRDRIGLVAQQPLLIGATLREAVIFPHRVADCDPQRFAFAVERSGVSAMAALFGRGLDTPIGEALVRLSGGQRQRLALAHALYRAQDLLLLDEATGQLDAESEQAIVGVIGALPRSLTIIVVSHRETPFAYCDAVYCLSEGRLHGESRHARVPDKAKWQK